MCGPGWWGSLHKAEASLSLPVWCPGPPHGARRPRPLPLPRCHGNQHPPATEQLPLLFILFGAYFCFQFLGLPASPPLWLIRTRPFVCDESGDRALEPSDAAPCPGSAPTSRGRSSMLPSLLSSALPETGSRPGSSGHSQGGKAVWSTEAPGAEAPLGYAHGPGNGGH